MAKKMNIYEYQTQLLGRPMTLVEVLAKVPNSIYGRSTRLAKACGAWQQKEYTYQAGENPTDINKCGTNPIYTRLIRKYWANLQTN